MKYVCLLVSFALFGLIVHNVTSEPAVCNDIGQPCGPTSEYQCCDGLNCISTNIGAHCRPQWWPLEKSESNKDVKVKLTKAQPLAEVMGWNCIGYKADCESEPNNCCEDMTCVKDAMSFWTCRYQ